MPLNVPLLRSSFDLVAPQADRLAKTFYETLFTNHPEAKPLFEGVAIDDQQQKLIQSLIVIVKSLEQPEKLNSYLKKLGVRHLDYRVSSVHYPLVQESMLIALETVAGEAWNEELYEAWDEALSVICSIMVEGASESIANAGSLDTGPPEQTAEELEDELIAENTEMFYEEQNMRQNARQLAAVSARNDSEAEDSALPKEPLTQDPNLQTPANFDAKQETQEMATNSVSPEIHEQNTNTDSTYYSMLEELPVQVLMTDQDLKITYLNKASENRLQELGTSLSVPVDQIVGQGLCTVFENLTDQQVDHSGSSSEHIRTQVGSETIDLLVSSVRDEQGNPIGKSITWSVVTKEIADDKQNRDFAAQMGAINKVMATIEFDLEGTILTANDNFLNTVGYSLEEVQGKHHRLFVEPDYAASPEYHSFWERLNRGEFITEEFRRLGKGGKEVWLQASYNPILDASGKPYKVVKYANDITQEVDNRKLQYMLDNVPINVMMTNRDLELIYMNPSSFNTLKTVEQLLPIPVDQMIGKKIDIFHKVPEMQRKLLADPANLPHRTKIMLGEEHLDLLVSAVYDNNGNYVGPMATWSVITAQVQMADDFERDVKGVIEVVTSSATEMQASSQSMTGLADETSKQAQLVAAASEEATKNVQTVASAAEELSASITEIARHVQDASQMTAQAVQEADRTNVTINELSDSSEEIGHVIKVITSIAQQTNLLALNATIEAARAGEAGKGFAVVANEVKELARQTAKATEEISQKIGAIQSATGGASTAIESISECISRINEISTTIASAVEEQTSATNEISRNVAEAATGTEEVSQNITKVSAAANESGQASSDILTASEGLSKESINLNDVATSFLERLRQM